MNYSKIKANFSDVINVKEDYDLWMMEIFMAKEDLLHQGEILKKNMDNENASFSEKFLSFRHHFIIIKESGTLIKEFYKKYENKILSMYNSERICELYDKYSNNYNDDISKKYAEIRNEFIHFKNIIKLRELFNDENFKDFEIELVVSEKTSSADEYCFVENIYYKCLMITLSKDESQLNDLLTSIAEIGGIMHNLLGEIIRGFLFQKIHKKDIYKIEIF